MKVRESKMKNFAYAASVACGLLVVGCASEVDPSDQPPVVPSSANTNYQYRPDVDAGIQVGPMPGDPLPGLVASMGPRLGSRRDPFALLPEENAFESSQRGERILQTLGGFSMMYDPPTEDATPLPVVEPQPYRRLAGVIVGESVLALIDMGDGRLEIIRPGQRIPNSEWTVVSIDEEKAILRRGGNKLPRQIEVRLESPPFGTGGGGGGPTGPTGGGPDRGGRQPGGAPPGDGGLAPPGGADK